MRTTKSRAFLASASALSGLVWASPALADCISQAPVSPNNVICSLPGTLGYNGSGTNNLTVTVNNNGANTVVATSAGGPALISAGNNSAVINYSGAFDPSTSTLVYGVDAGAVTNPAISVGAGSIVTNDSGAAIRGTITFGNATGTTASTLNNNYSNLGSVNHIGLIDGAVTAAGNFNLNNMGVLGSAPGNSPVTQTGSGTVNISNGIDGGYVAPYTLSGSTYQNGLLSGNITTAGDTSLVNHGGGNARGAVIAGNVTVGTGGSGTSTITNGSVASGNATIAGSVTMADAKNVLTNDGTITGNVTLNGTGTNTYNAGSPGSSGDNGLRLPGSQVSAAGIPTGVVSGSLTGLASNAANNVLNLNGTGASTLQAGSVISGFGVVNKNDSGSWTVKATLDANAGKLSKVNVGAGLLSVDNASFLGGSGSTVSLANGSTLNFNGTAAGTFAGNIVDATNANTGAVTVTGPSVTTLSGTNSYSGTTTINGGSLATGSSGALSPNSAFTVSNGGTLTINNPVTLKSLADAGTGPNTVNLNGASTGLTLSSGSWGANGGTIVGTGTLTKSSSGTLALGGTNAVNLSAPGTFVINDGTVNVAAANAIGPNTAVQVNSGSSTTGILNVNQSDTIGSLAGTGANAQVNIATGQTLTTGGLNSSTTYAGHIAGAGALVKAGTGAMTLTGGNSYSGGTTVAGGNLIGYAGSTATNGSLQGNIAVGSGNTVTFDQRLSPNGDTSGTYAGQLSGAGNAVFFGNGTGILTLSGNNSALTGPMTFSTGSIVSIGAPTNVGTGPLNFTGGTLNTTATMTLPNAVGLGAGGGTLNTASGTTLTESGVISGTGSLTKAGTGTLVLTGANTYTGGTTVSAGILSGSAGTGLQGNIANNSEVDFTGSGTYAGNMSGTGKVLVTNSSTVGFSGTNSYSGSTTINSGSTLNALSAGALSPASAFIVNGTLNSVTPGTNTIGSLAGSGAVNVGDTLNIGNDNSSTTFSGTLTGSKVNKIGTGTLNLSGAANALTGAVGVNAGTLSVTGKLADASTTVASGATLSVDGTLTSPTVTVASGGTLVGGSATVPGTIVGAVTNNGTISPGHSGPGIIAINGSFAQSATGTYMADVNGNGTGTVVAGTDYDQIAVSGTPGTAALGGTLAVQQNGGLYVAGTKYNVVTTTGGITGNFATITGNVISPFVTLSNTAAAGGGIVGNNYVLIVVRNPYNTVAQNANQAAVASGLQGLVGVAGASATIVKIDNMTAAQAQALFQGLDPQPYGAYATALQDQGNLFARQVALRQESVTDKDGPGVWLNGYGSWAKGRNHDFLFGSDQKIYGLAGGVDFTTMGLRAGIAAGYSHDKVTYRGGNSRGRDNSWQVGAYAGYAAGPLDVDGQLDYIHGSISAVKLVSAGTGATLIAGEADARTSGHLFKAIGTIGYNLGGPHMKAEPYVGVDFASGHVNGFTETGSLGVLGLTVNSISAKRTDVLAGVKLEAPAGAITPYLNAAFRYRVSGNHNRLITAYFDGMPSTVFTVNALNSGRSQLDVDAGVRFGIGRGASAFIGYEGTFRRDLRAHGVNAGFAYNFGVAPPPPPPPPPPAPPPPPPPPATQTCPDGSVIPATATCPAPPPPPPPPAPAPQRG